MAGKGLQGFLWPYFFCDKEQKMTCRGVRGATSVDANDERMIIKATRALLERVVSVNGIEPEEIASVVFTSTSDLDASYPARAAREIGWNAVPLLCMQEMSVRGSLPRCVRVLIMWNTDTPSERIKHVYLGAAAALRPDLANKEEK